MRIAVRLVSSARHRAPLWVVVLAFLGGPAASQDGAGDWYAKLFGGATFPQAEEFEIATISDGGEDGPLGVDLSFDTGWLFGVAVGRRVARRGASASSSSSRTVAPMAQPTTSRGRAATATFARRALPIRGLCCSMCVTICFPSGRMTNGNRTSGWGLAPPT